MIDSIFLVFFISFTIVTSLWLIYSWIYGIGDDSKHQQTSNIDNNDKDDNKTHDIRKQELNETNPSTNSDEEEEEKKEEEEEEKKDTIDATTNGEELEEFFNVIDEENALNAMKQNIRALAEKYKNKNDEYGALNTKYDSLEEEHKTLEEEHKTLKEEHINLGEEHKTLEEEHKTLQTEQEALKNGHKRLKKQHETKQNEYDKLSEMFIISESNKNELNKQLTTKNDEYNVLNQQYTDKNTEYDGLRNRYKTSVFLNFLLFFVCVPIIISIAFHETETHYVPFSIYQTEINKLTQEKVKYQQMLIETNKNYNELYQEYQSLQPGIEKMKDMKDSNYSHRGSQEKSSRQFHEKYESLKQKMEEIKVEHDWDDYCELETTEMIQFYRKSLSCDH